jgi:hypothetical protein
MREMLSVWGGLACRERLKSKRRIDAQNLPNLVRSPKKMRGRGKAQTVQLHREKLARFLRPRDSLRNTHDLRAWAAMSNPQNGHQSVQLAKTV